MQLFHSPRSPFVKKVLVVAWEVGVGTQIELLACQANHIHRDASIIAHNPLGQVPTLILSDGMVLNDSRVICEYLDTTFQGRLYPASGEARWRTLQLDAVADGMMAAAVLAGLEQRLRPEPMFFRDWFEGQIDKVISCVRAFESRLDMLSGPVTIATISVASGLSYLDARLPQVEWRTRAGTLAEWLDTFSERESMLRTRLLS